MAFIFSAKSPMKKLMARWIVFAGFVLFALPAHAQTFTITGTVASNGEGIAGISVVLSGEKADTTTTGQNGEFTFADLAAGTYCQPRDEPDSRFLFSFPRSSVDTSRRRLTK